MLMRPAKAVSLFLLLTLPGAAITQAVFSLFVGTREEVAARMIDLAKLKKGDVVTDLGSGDGRLVIASAKSNPGVTGFGVAKPTRRCKKLLS